MSEEVKRYRLRRDMPATAWDFLPDVVIDAADHDRIVSSLTEAGVKMQAQVEQLTKERDKAVRSEQFIEQWYAVRFRRLEDLGKARGCWDEMAAIIANGTESGNDPINYAGQLNISRHRATLAEQERDQLAARCRELEEHNRERDNECARMLNEAWDERDTLRAEVEQARGTAEHWKVGLRDANDEVEQLQEVRNERDKLAERCRELEDEIDRVRDHSRFVAEATTRVGAVLVAIRTALELPSDAGLLDDLVPAIDTLRAEVERLTGCLQKANEQAEHFEREWYLRGDEVERLRANDVAYRAVLYRIRRECGADEFGAARLQGMFLLAHESACRLLDAMTERGDLSRVEGKPWARTVAIAAALEASR